MNYSGYPDVNIKQQRCNKELTSTYTPNISQQHEIDSEFQVVHSEEKQ